MTREEAITYGKRVIDLGLNDETQAFCEMAIKALEQETCDDVISRQAVLDEISDYNNDLDYTTNELYDRIKRMSSVNPQPKTGHWIFDEILDKHYYCSECKSMGVDYWDFCPYCGAKMVEPQESEG